MSANHAPAHIGAALPAEVKRYERGLITSNEIPATWSYIPGSGFVELLKARFQQPRRHRCHGVERCRRFLKKPTELLVKEPVRHRRLQYPAVQHRKSAWHSAGSDLHRFHRNRVQPE